MHILEVYLESGGFDYRLIKGGISVYLWNLTRAFNSRGHQTSVLSALNGHQEYLESQHGLEKLDYLHEWEMDLQVDPSIWGDRVVKSLPLRTEAYRLHKDGTDFYYLSNSFLDAYPDTYYPPYEGKGSDIYFFKPLVFQMEAVFFIREWFKCQDVQIHAHEPYYQYMLPIAFQDDPSKKVASTVQSNMPITKKVYAPKVEALLQQLGISVDIDEYKDVAPDTLFNRCLIEYLPRTHLNYPYREDYISFYNLILRHTDLVDFLSDGQREFYSSFYGTAFRALFVQLDVYKQYQVNAHKLFVGGCALSDSWLKEGFTAFDRDKELMRLELDPALPVFFHNARYAPNHKGQVEMILAVRRFLAAGKRANFILRCISGSGVPDQRFHDLARDYPDQVRFTWEIQDEVELKAAAAAADFALFPSKFEMDTFLIAQGEAMVAGCVPIASNQLGMKHWLHGECGADKAEARTGFAIIRSFLEEDERLVESIFQGICDAADLFGNPAKYAEMSKRARTLALTFSWTWAADLHIEMFEGLEKSGCGLNAPIAQRQTFNTWQEAALKKGQILDYRSEGGMDVPSLTYSRGHLTYRCKDTASVTVFVWHYGVFHERQMSQSQKDGDFVEGDLPGDRIILLVTRKNGDQFWDGLISTQEFS